MLNSAGIQMTQRSVAADPLRVYRHLPKGHRILLESNDPAHPDSRFSFVAACPRMRVTGSGSRLTLVTGNRRDEASPRDLLDVLRGEIDRDLTRGDPSFPSEVPFSGGWMGWFSYDYGRWLERLPTRTRRDLDFPVLELGFFPTFVAIDHFQGRTFVVSRSGDNSERADAWGLHERAVSRALDEPSDNSSSGYGPSEPERAEHAPVSDLAPREYLASIERIKKLIHSGEIYQTNFTHRFRTSWNGSPEGLYGRLRETNPAPFAALVELSNRKAIVSASPERFFELRGRRVSSRPIKGTRPRTADRIRDLELSEELLSSEKDRAELNMIIDLIRNDLGRVCRPGSIDVPQSHGLEFHPTVLHLVATVVGELAAGKDGFDLMNAMFPGGSITGAPKIRAMEVIEDLEDTQRSIYTGSIGYFGIDGDADWNIAIRTVAFEGGRAVYSVGGGIVADSDPCAEYNETLDKGLGIARAFGFPSTLGRNQHDE